MNISTKDMSRKELLKLQKQVEAQLKRLEAKDKKKALEAAQKAVSAMGFTLDEVMGASAAKPKRRASSAKAKKVSPPKYANPEDKTQTWTGKGRQPAWFKKAVKSGRSPDDLTIK